MYKYSAPGHWQPFYSTQSGFARVTEPTFPLTEKEISRAVEKAVSVPTAPELPDFAEIDPEFAITEEPIPTASEELAMATEPDTAAEELAAEPELPDAAAAEVIDAAAEAESAPSEAITPTEPDLSMRKVAFDEIVARLVDAMKDGELKEESAELLAILYEFEDRACALVARHRKGKLEKLARRWEVAKVEAREQLDAVRRLQLERPPLESDLRRWKSESSNCRAEVLAWEDAKPRPETFPTAAEEANWKRRLDAAQAALNQANRRETETLELLRDHDARVREENQKLKKLAEAEADLRTAKDGKSVRSREYGFLTPAEKF